MLLPQDQIRRIRYFTAHVGARPHDPQQPVRQQAYLRALQTLPGPSVHLGHYLVSYPRMPLRYPQASGPRTVEVIKSEEKGSDVNLATYLLLDAFRRDCDTAVVITNDSDLREPIEIAQAELGIIPAAASNPGKPDRPVPMPALDGRRHGHLLYRQSAPMSRRTFSGWRRCRRAAGRGPAGGGDPVKQQGGGGDGALFEVVQLRREQTQRLYSGHHRYLPGARGWIGA